MGSTLQYTVSTQSVLISTQSVHSQYTDPDKSCRPPPSSSPSLSSSFSRQRPIYPVSPASARQQVLILTVWRAPIPPGSHATRPIYALSGQRIARMEYTSAATVRAHVWTLGGLTTNVFTPVYKQRIEKTTSPC